MWYIFPQIQGLGISAKGIEDVTFKSTLEEAYQELNLTTPSEQVEFLEFLFSVEITQSDPEDFWVQYIKLSGETLTDEEKLEIRKGIRSETVKYLSRNFYINLANAIKDGKVADVNTMFYLVRSWELDVFGHLEYTKADSVESAKDFILWNDQVQQSLFGNIGESIQMDVSKVEEMYDSYCLQAKIGEEIYDNCNVSGYDEYKQQYILAGKENYSTKEFSRNKVMKLYIESKTEQEMDK